MPTANNNQPRPLEPINWYQIERGESDRDLVGGREIQDGERFDVMFRQRGEIELNQVVRVKKQQLLLPTPHGMIPELRTRAYIEIRYHGEPSKFFLKQAGCRLRVPAPDINLPPLPGESQGGTQPPQGPEQPPAGPTGSGPAPANS